MSKFKLPKVAEIKIESFLTEECVLQKAKLLKEIKSLTGLYYFELEHFLFLEKRTLIRINSLNNLVPCIRNLFYEKVIPKTVIYEIATNPPAEQYELYEQIIRYLNLKKQIKVNKKMVSVAEYKEIKESV